MIDNIGSLTHDQIEAVEKLTTRWVFQAVLDFGIEAHEIFVKSPDEVKDVAEDITREVLDRLSGFNISQRVFGTVDYKKARYIILPEHLIRQALFVDSKAEKENRTATIQMSQTSMRVRHIRSGNIVDQEGRLPPISVYDGKQYLTTTAFLHFTYADVDYQHYLKEVTIFCLPNGLLQDKYNPNPEDTIWLAGRNAPTLGEDFRVRLGFSRLKEKATWRMQKVYYSETQQVCKGLWDD